MLETKRTPTGKHKRQSQTDRMSSAARTQRGGSLLWRSSQNVVLLSLISLTVFTVGCGSSERPVVPVRGTVTLDGKPLDHGTVSFVPNQERGSKGSMGIGQIGTDGRFEVLTDPHGAAKHGVAPGSYLVRVSEPVGSAEFGLPPPPVVPAKYSDLKTSGIEFEIRAGESREFDITLTSQK